MFSWLSSKTLYRLMLMELTHVPHVNVSPNRDSKLRLPHKPLLKTNRIRIQLKVKQSPDRKNSQQSEKKTFFLVRDQNHPETTILMHNLQTRNTLLAVMRKNTMVLINLTVMIWTKEEAISHRMQRIMVTKDKDYHHKVVH